MKRLLLTSTGFENSNFSKLFLSEIGIPANEIKVLFISTAAIYDEAISVLPKCYADLTNCGVISENITVYDLDRKIDEGELCEYNAIYVCGGFPEYLMKRMNAVDFVRILKSAFKNNAIYVGVSAGSIVFGTNLENNLGLYGKQVGVHCKSGSYGDDFVYLTNRQAIWICGERSEIIE